MRQQVRALRGQYTSAGPDKQSAALDDKSCGTSEIEKNRESWRSLLRKEGVSRWCAKNKVQSGLRWGLTDVMRGSQVGHLMVAFP